MTKIRKASEVWLAFSGTSSPMLAISFVQKETIMAGAGSQGPPQA